MNSGREYLTETNPTDQKERPFGVRKKAHKARSVPASRSVVLEEHYSSCPLAWNTPNNPLRGIVAPETTRQAPC